RVHQRGRWSLRKGFDDSHDSRAPFFQTVPAERPIASQLLVGVADHQGYIHPRRPLDAAPRHGPTVYENQIVIVAQLILPFRQGWLSQQMDWIGFGLPQWQEGKARRRFDGINGLIWRAESLHDVFPARLRRLVHSDGQATSIQIAVDQ